MYERETDRPCMNNILILSANMLRLPVDTVMRCGLPEKSLALAGTRKKGKRVVLIRHIDPSY